MTMILRTRHKTTDDIGFVALVSVECSGTTVTIMDLDGKMANYDTGDYDCMIHLPNGKTWIPFC